MFYFINLINSLLLLINNYYYQLIWNLVFLFLYFLYKQKQNKKTCDIYKFFFVCLIYFC